MFDLFGPSALFQQIDVASRAEKEEPLHRIKILSCLIHA
jgi:hypothetical protein